VLLLTNHKNIALPIIPLNIIFNLTQEFSPLAQ
jgi:hypothetical protein